MVVRVVDKCRRNYFFHFFTQFDEQKDQVVVERVLRVVFLDAERSTPVRQKRVVFYFGITKPIVALPVISPFHDI